MFYFNKKARIFPNI